MKFLRNVSIRNKLIIAALIPLFGLLYYLQITIRNDLKSKRAAKQVLVNVSEVQEISKVVHELQKERALTLTFLFSNGNKAREQLTEQREVTDHAFSQLGKVLKDHNQSLKSYSSLDSLPAIRAKVNLLRSVGEIDPFYYNFKLGLLDDISLILRSTDNIEFKNRFEEHLSLLYTKEFLAQLRSALGTVLAAGKFFDDTYGNFASVKGKHEINLHKFKTIASPELREYFNRKYQNAFVQQTHTTIDSAFLNTSLFNSNYN
jgi:methyl-accepting chemotaxis protein